MSETIRITKKLKNKIDDICEEGDLLIIDSYDYTNAIEKFKEALELVPDPKEEFDTTTWIYTAIADAYYLNNQTELAMEYLNMAYKLPSGENGFVLFRLGQCYRIQDDMEKAKDYLKRAYELSGEEVFGEDIEDLNLAKS